MNNMIEEMNSFIYKTFSLTDTIHALLDTQFFVHVSRFSDLRWSHVVLTGAN